MEYPVRSFPLFSLRPHETKIVKILEGQYATVVYDEIASLKGMRNYAIA